jgi:hypothetical protein
MRKKGTARREKKEKEEKKGRKFRVDHGSTWSS